MTASLMDEARKTPLNRSDVQNIMAQLSQFLSRNYLHEFPFSEEELSAIRDISDPMRAPSGPVSADNLTSAYMSDARVARFSDVKRQVLADKIEAYLKPHLSKIVSELEHTSAADTENPTLTGDKLKQFVSIASMAAMGGGNLSKEILEQVNFKSLNITRKDTMPVLNKVASLSSKKDGSLSRTELEAIIGAEMQNKTPDTAEPVRNYFLACFDVAAGTKTKQILGEIEKVSLEEVLVNNSHVRSAIEGEVLKPEARAKLCNALTAKLHEVKDKLGENAFRFFGETIDSFRDSGEFKRVNCHDVRRFVGDGRNIDRDVLPNYSRYENCTRDEQRVIADAVDDVLEAYIKTQASANFSRDRTQHSSTPRRTFRLDGRLDHRGPPKWEGLDRFYAQEGPPPLTDMQRYNMLEERLHPERYDTLVKDITAAIDALKPQLSAEAWTAVEKTREFAASLGNGSWTIKEVSLLFGSGYTNVRGEDELYATLTKQEGDLIWKAVDGKINALMDVLHSERPRGGSGRSGMMFF